MAASISAPVGEKNRESKGPPVQNRTEDVEMIQLMLVANGITVPVDGKVSKGLIEAIKKFQSAKAGIKNPDGVVDPGKTTWKHGLSKLEAKLKADQERLANLVEVTENGKTKYITKEQYEKNIKEMQKAVQDRAKSMQSAAESWISFSQECTATAIGAEGFMMSFTSFIVSSVSRGKSEPPYGTLGDARSAATRLLSAAKQSNPDWKKIKDLDSKAVAAHNKGVVAFSKFIQTRISTASAIVGKLVVVREMSFAAVEAYLTARIMVTKRVSPAKAHAIASASTEALKSGAGQLGEYLAGNKVTWNSALKKVVIDTAFAGAAGLAGGKLSDAFSKQIVGKLSTALISQVGKTFPHKALDIFLNKIMTTKAAQEVVTSGAKESIGLLKPIIEKGRAPNEKEIKEALTKTITAGLMGSSPSKALKAFGDKLPAKVQESITTKILPKLSDNVLKDLTKKYGKAAVDKLPRAFQEKLFKDVANGVKGKAAELYALGAAEGSSGDLKESHLHKLGHESLLKDRALQKKMEDMIRTQMEQKLKKASKKQLVAR